VGNFAEHREGVSGPRSKAPALKPRKSKPITKPVMPREATTPAEVVDYDSLISLLRNRADELEISRETLNEIAGLPDRLVSKILGLKRVRRIGMLTLGPLLDALGIKLIAVPDEAALARNRSRYVKRDDAHYRSVMVRLWQNPSRMIKRANRKFVFTVSRSEKKNRPIPERANSGMGRNVGTPTGQSVNGRPLTNTRCVSDSDALATRSSQNFGTIESGFAQRTAFSKFNGTLGYFRICFEKIRTTEPGTAPAASKRSDASFSIVSRCAIN
jgi:hypothetical protein